MAFSDLCKINNAFKTVENEPDQSDRIMDENEMVRDIITKILDEPGPAEGHNSLSSPEKTLGLTSNSPCQYNITVGNASFLPPSTFTAFQDTPLYNFPIQTQEQNGFNYSNVQNGFSNSNGFINFPDNDIGSLLGMDSLGEASQDSVSAEQLHLLRLAAQEIAGAQFTGPMKNYDKGFNVFEPNQRNSLPDPNMYLVGNNFNRPNSLNLDSLGYNTNSLPESNPFSMNPNNMRYRSKYSDNFIKDSSNAQDSPNDLSSYLNQMNLSLEQRSNVRDDILMPNNMQDFTKLPIDMNSHTMNYQNGDDSGHFKLNDEQLANKMFPNFNQNNYQQMSGSIKPYNGIENNYYLNEMMKQMGNDKSNFGLPNQNFDAFTNAQPNVPVSAAMNYKPNGFQHQSDSFLQRRDIGNQVMPPRDGYQNNGPINDKRSFDMSRDNMQQANMMRQKQELARQILLMRNRQPQNQLNVDVSFMHENPQFNMGLGPLLGPSPPVAPPVLPSPMLDLPLLAPFYAMRNMRRAGAPSSSGVLHARLDACYEQWRQLERERKRTEARLALAFPGRAVSSSNSIPVPRLPPCPTRVDRLTVDMLREHTKVLTLMGKMETLRASVCVQTKKSSKSSEDGKITLLKRGQENNGAASDNAVGSDPTSFDPSTWKEDVKHLSEIAPHSEVESAMLSWRNAVGGVQAARRRELAPSIDRYQRQDPILQLADAVKELSGRARRARCAMWCDLTLTVALAPRLCLASEKPEQAAAQATATANQAQQDNGQTKVTANSSKPNDAKDVNMKDAAKSDTKTIDNKSNKQTQDKTSNDSQKTESQTSRTQQRKNNNYNRHKMNHGRTDFYQKNQRYDHRFAQRHPFHYLATGPIN